MKNPITSGIAELKADIRDFPFHKIYGEASAIPLMDFDISDEYPIILDQSYTEDCTGAATAGLNEVFSWPMLSLSDYLGLRGQDFSRAARAQLAYGLNLVPSPQAYLDLAASGQNGDINLQIIAALRQGNGDYFDYLYQFSKICQVMGQPSTNGADIRTAMQALVNYGSLPKRNSPFTVGTGGPTDRLPAFLADWRNWDPKLDQIASRYKVPSFFAATGSGDAFDNIRSALWQSKMQNLKAGVNFGTYWKSQWTDAPGGIIVDDGSAPTTNSIGGHDGWFRGQKMISGVPYLKFQNSWGKGKGDKGFYYFPRSVVNQMFPIFGAFVPSSLPKATALQWMSSGIMAGDSWITRIIKTYFK